MTIRPLEHRSSTVTTTSTRARRTRGVVAVLASLAVVLGGAAITTAPARAVEGDLSSDLVGWWKLDETSGTVAADSSGNGRNGTVTGTASWNAGDGFTFSGGSSSSGNAIALPNNLLTDLDNVTVDLDVWVDSALTGNWFMFNLGNLATYPNGTGYLFVTGKDASSRFRATIAENGFATEQSAYRAGGLTTGVWKHVTYSVTGGSVSTPGSSRLYEDGVLVASNTNITTKPSLLGEPNGSTTRNILGRSAYAGDQSFKGRLRDVRVYSRALTAGEATTRAEGTNTQAAESDAAALSLGDTSAVTGNLTLPATGPSGSSITWSSSDTAVVENNGTVHRPAHGQPDGTATLTATVTRGTISRTRDFAITVLAEELDDAGKAQEAVGAVTLVHADDVRGNLTLPTTGLYDASLSWSSGDPSVVTPTGEVTRPAYGEQPVDVALTVTATKNAATAERSIVVRVEPMPAPTDYDAYAFAYFAGESTDDGEKIYFAASKGDHPLAYDELNNGKPVLSSTFGTKGLRDPFIIRSHEGDRFYLLATDLKAYPAVDFGQAQETGSKYMEIWESTDLVHWSNQRHVKVSSGFAGNTWAPEAFYDEQAGEYVVYWASALYPTIDESTRDINTSYQRMMYATTRDFVTFSEAKPWVDVKRGTGKGMIDATVVKDGDTFYRMVKDEAYMIPRQEKSTDLRATVTGSLPTTTSTPGWQLVKEKIGYGQQNPWGGTFTGGEGPTVFRDNNDPGRWYMFIDQPSYHGGQGYLAFTTDDIASGDWTSVPSAVLPSSPRHGTVIPVTQAELDAMRAAYQPNLLVRSVEDVTVSTRQGVAPTLPATVPARFGDGTTGQAAVTWDAVDPAVYAEPGTFEVAGKVTSGAADEPHASVKVTDAHDPVVTLTAPANGGGWSTTDPTEVSVTATDDTGVVSVETSVDGGAWATVGGDHAFVPVAGDGDHVVRARARDVTGNTSADQSLTVHLDATPPLSRATYDDARMVTIRAADATSGVDHIEMQIGDALWTTYTAPVAVGSAGTTVGYRAVDHAGNVEATNELVVPRVGADLLTSAVVAVADSDKVPLGGAVGVTVRVNGIGGTPTGIVRVWSGGTVLAAGQLSDGRSRMVVDTTALGVGKHTLVVRYDGDDRYAPSEDTLVLTVTKPKGR
jgi:hypothetical protein